MVFKIEALPLTRVLQEWGWTSKQPAAYRLSVWIRG